MDGRLKPDGQSDSANDLNDDEIIDLTQVVQQGNDDEIIDLTNVLDQPEKTPETLNMNESTDPLPDEDDIVIDLEEPVAGDDADEEAVVSMDEEIIDLVDMETTLEANISESPSSDDEVTIDLMDAVEPQAEAAETVDVTETTDPQPEAEITMVDALDLAEDADAAPEDDEEIIDLTEMETGLDENDADNPTDENADDEDIIDLMDAVEPQAAATEPAALSEITDSQPEAENTMIDALDPTEDADAASADGEEIIDLTEMETGLDENRADSPVKENADDEDIIDLMDAVEPVPVPEETPASGTLDVERGAETGDEQSTLAEEEMGETGNGLTPGLPIDADADTAITVTEEQLETALERTIKKIYAEKIEQLLIETIEKTVQQEIEKIKRALLEDDEDMSN